MVGTDAQSHGSMVRQALEHAIHWPRENWNGVSNGHMIRRVDSQVVRRRVWWCLKTSPKTPQNAPKTPPRPSRHFKDVPIHIQKPQDSCKRPPTFNFLPKIKSASFALDISQKTRLRTRSKTPQNDRKTRPRCSKTPQDSPRLLKVIQNTPKTAPKKFQDLQRSVQNASRYLPRRSKR